MEVIKIEKLNYAYPGGVKVFEGLNFSMKKGERIGIVGANGSGKTTLFSLVMGLVFPQRGVVSLFGRPCPEEKDFVHGRKRIGYLFQDPDDQVFCPTVEEDIAFGPLNLGFSSEDVSEIVTKVSGELGIEPLRKRITTRLSWGQKRLVSLAGVLAMRPEVLILDEPTSSIDDSVVKKITGCLKQADHSLLIASHDKQFLRGLDVDVCLLKDGMLTKQ